MTDKDCRKEMVPYNAARFQLWCERQPAGSNLDVEDFKRDMAERSQALQDWILSTFDPDTRVYTDGAFAICKALSSLVNGIELSLLEHGGEAMTQNDMTALKVHLIEAASKFEFYRWGTEFLQQFYVLRVKDSFAYVGDELKAWQQSEMDGPEGEADAFGE